jgi:hypothetical protein
MLDVQKVKVIARLGLFLVMIAFIALPVLMPAPVAAESLADIVSVDDVATGAGFDTEGADFKTTIGRLIKVALGFLGIVAIIIVLIGGFKYMTAGGSDDKVADAKKWIISGIIGLAIILSAYTLTSFVITQLLEASSGAGAGGAE